MVILPLTLTQCQLLPVGIVTVIANRIVHGPSSRIGSILIEMIFAQDAILAQYVKIVDSKLVGFLYAWTAWKRWKSRTFPLPDNIVIL